MHAAINDPQFKRLQHWFTPPVVRRSLARYFELQESTPRDEHEDKRVKRSKLSPYAGFERVSDLKASIDWAIGRLAVDDPLAHTVIVGLYLEREGWAKVSSWTNLPVTSHIPGRLTVVMVENRGVHGIARYLGHRREVRSE